MKYLFTILNLIQRCLFDKYHFITSLSYDLLVFPDFNVPVSIKSEFFQVIGKKGAIMLILGDGMCVTPAFSETIIAIDLKVAQIFS